MTPAPDDLVELVAQSLCEQLDGHREWERALTEVPRNDSHAAAIVSYLNLWRREARRIIGIIRKAELVLATPPPPPPPPPDAAEGDGT